MVNPVSNLGVGLEIDLKNRQLRWGQRDIALTPRAFGLLAFLAARPRTIATTEEILDAVWPNVVVEEGQVRQFVAELRRALGDDARAPRLIETVRGRGYRFIGEARLNGETSARAGGRVVALYGEVPRRRRNGPLHGRDDDLQALAERLGRYPVVTIVGAGGVGKTALARQLAAQARVGYADGVVTVELAPVGDPALVASTIAEATGVGIAPGDEPLAALVAGLGGRRVLLVLDNAEHLLDEVARIVPELVDGAPHLRLLVTSQSPLRVAGEHVYRLGGLPVPAADGGLADAEEHGAVALFAARARASDARFALDAATVGPVVDICRRLDGMPLALEWAAARLGALGLAGLREALDARLDSAPALRGVPSRQRTLAAALDWTHGLLTAPQQQVFRRLGVFAGPFERTAAESVGADVPVGRLDAAGVGAALEALADSSLIVPEDGAEARDGARRWRLLQVTRRYALERLDDAGELHAVRRRQIAFHLEALKAWPEVADGEASTTSLASIRERYPDIRGALEWAFSGSAGDAAAGAALAVALLPYWRRLPRQDEGERWLQRPGRAPAGPAADDRLARLVQRLRAEGVVPDDPAGLDQVTLMALARRLGEADLRRPEVALRQLQGAVDLAREAVATPAGAPPTGIDPALDALVARTLGDVAGHTRIGDFDRGLDAVDQALVAIDERQAEQAAARTAARRALHEAGLRQALLRRDSFGAADRVLALVAVEGSDRPAWSAEAQARFEAFRAEGGERGITLSLQVAAELARRRVESAATATERRGALHALATTLLIEGDRDGGVERLEEAAAAFREALDACGVDRALRPVLLGGLGETLCTIGARLGRLDTLREAVDACREALGGLRRSDAPREWGDAHFRLATALRNLGAMETGSETLEEALGVYDEALKVRTPARDPLAWARTKQGIGVVHSMLGRRESQTPPMRRAVACYREALQEATRERAPLDWAALQSNLGIELAAIGDMERDPAILQEAIAAYGESMLVFQRDRYPASWAISQHNLGGALRLLGELQEGTARLNEAVVAFQEALREHRRLRVPSRWAATKTDLGMALIRLGQREGGTPTLEEAVRVLRQALEVRTREKGEMPWAATLADLAEALLAFGDAGGPPSAYREAAETCRQALEVLSPDAWADNHRRVKGYLEEAESKGRVPSPGDRPAGTGGVR